MSYSLDTSQDMVRATIGCHLPPMPLQVLVVFRQTNNISSPSQTSCSRPGSRLCSWTSARVAGRLTLSRHQLLDTFLNLLLRLPQLVQSPQTPHRRAVACSALRAQSFTPQAREARLLPFLAPLRWRGNRQKGQTLLYKQMSNQPLCIYSTYRTYPTQL